MPPKEWSSREEIYDFSRTEAKGHSDPETKCDPQWHQDVSTHQIWDSYLEYYKRYALNTIILELRSGVQVTVTQ